METPFSVITNLAYVIAGLYVLRGRRIRITTEKSGFGYMHGRTRTLASWLVGISFVLLGLASGAFHWAYEPWAQLMDERGMYLAFSVLAGVLWDNSRPVHDIVDERLGPTLTALARWMLRWLGLALGITLAAFAAQVDSMIVMPALALVCIAGVWIAQGFQRALMFFIGFLAIAAIRELPEANFWARDPLFGYDLIHGLRHLTTALFMYYLYKSTEG